MRLLTWSRTEYRLTLKLSSGARDLDIDFQKFATPILAELWSTVTNVTLAPNTNWPNGTILEEVYIRSGSLTWLLQR